MLQALVDAQYRLRKTVDNFHFNLGFSGKYFQAGTEEENAGDEAIIGNVCVIEYCQNGCLINGSCTGGVHSQVPL